MTYQTTKTPQYVVCGDPTYQSPLVFLPGFPPSLAPLEAAAAAEANEVGICVGIVLMVSRIRKMLLSVFGHERGVRDLVGL